LLRNEALFNPNPSFGDGFQVTINDARSNYSALQLQYRRPLTNRVQALASYTYSHSLDNASDDVVTAIPNVIISNLNDYASSDFDVRHNFSAALSINFPSAGTSTWLFAVTKDWSLQSVAAVRTGFPLNGVVFSYAPGGYAFSRPDHVANQPYWVSNLGAPGGQSLNPNAFALPNGVRQGTEGRNDISGFGLTQIDLSLGRDFPIGERMKFQFRADTFNICNHPNFTNPSALVEFGSAYLLSRSTLNDGLGGLNPLFQQGGPRSIQLAAKLTF
jgi:hypothetical protein